MNIWSVIGIVLLLISLILGGYIELSENSKRIKEIIEIRKELEDIKKELERLNASKE